VGYRVKHKVHTVPESQRVCRSKLDGSICTPGDITVGNQCSNAEEPGEYLLVGLTSCRERAHCASDMIDCRLEKFRPKPR